MKSTHTKGSPQNCLTRYEERVRLYESFACQLCSWIAFDRHRSKSDKARFQAQQAQQHPQVDIEAGPGDCSEEGWGSGNENFVAEGGGAGMCDLC